MQQFDGHELEYEVNTVSKDQVGPSPQDGCPSHTSPIGARYPPSYADITRKKQATNSGSFDDDSIEQLSKKAGRKSKKEVQEEEAERLKMQGSQPTIEMSYGRNKRNKPPKGVITPSHLGK